jgi:hypothetical protein
MKAYVNVLILFFWFTTLTYSRKEYWSHEYGKFTTVVIKVLE